MDGALHASFAEKIIIIIITNDNDNNNNTIIIIVRLIWCTRN